MAIVEDSHNQQTSPCVLELECGGYSLPHRAVHGHQKSADRQHQAARRNGKYRDHAHASFTAPPAAPGAPARRTSLSGDGAWGTGNRPQIVRSTTDNGSN